MKKLATNCGLAYAIWITFRLFEEVELDTFIKVTSSTLLFVFCCVILPFLAEKGYQFYKKRKNKTEK